MAERPLRILQVSRVDSEGGGDGRVAWELFNGYRTRGHGSWLAVGHKHVDHPDVLEMPHHLTRRRWAGFWWRLRHRLKPQAHRPSMGRAIFRLCRGVAEPGSRWDKTTGREDFRYPGAWHLLECIQPSPDLLQCHNLHEGYFDLRALPWLSHQAPLVLTLHDAWLLSGHCAHSFECERWKTGCGHCPDLTIYPSVKRDATAFNWQRKRALYARSRLFVATPSRWLMGKVEQSILAAGTAEARVIPNGVNLEVFRPADPQAARAQLGLPPQGRIVLFTADGFYGSLWKDAPTLRRALTLCGQELQRQGAHLVCVGDARPLEGHPAAGLHFIPFQRTPAGMACAFQAAVLYVHPARADTFPNLVLEAQACGCPVLGTAVGGIPEQIEDGVTGFVTAPGNAEEMAEKLNQILGTEGLHLSMSQAAVERARRLYNVERQIEEYLGWFHQLRERRLSGGS